MVLITNCKLAPLKGVKPTSSKTTNWVERTKLAVEIEFPVVPVNIS